MDPGRLAVRRGRRADELTGRRAQYRVLACDAGDVAIGGGWRTTQTSHEVDILQSYPKAGDSRRWIILAAGGENNVTSFQPYVICQDVTN